MKWCAISSVGCLLCGSLYGFFNGYLDAISDTKVHQKFPPPDTMVLSTILFSIIGLVIGIVLFGAIRLFLWFVRNVLLL